MSIAVFGIATRYTLDGRGIEYRWKSRFYETVQSGPGNHPTSCEWVMGLYLVGKAVSVWG
jgi:hypothetical protein